MEVCAGVAFFLLGCCCACAGSVWPPAGTLMITGDYPLFWCNAPSGIPLLSMLPDAG
jgi:hypothetical protein